MIEIGSEFYWEVFPDEENLIYPKWLRFGDDQVLTFSGRTAIEFVLLDIMRDRQIRKVLLPSYCCDSMIDPFRKYKIEVEFYDVSIHKLNAGLNIELTIPREIDLVYCCNYFGYQIEFPKSELKIFKENGGIILEDITHSLFQFQPLHLESDYYVASIRKWGPVLSGGLCCKKKGSFAEIELTKPSQCYQKSKMNAMRMKAFYLKDVLDGKKKEYLELFQQCNKELAESYSRKKIDDISLTILNQWDGEYVKQIRRIRQNNSRILHDEIKEIEGIRTLFDLQEGDCPLFVPIICEQGRDALRKKMIDERIYCPVHWPRPTEHCKSSLYDVELSLVCDQRYSEIDMQHMCEVIRNELK